MRAAALVGEGQISLSAIWQVALVANGEITCSTEDPIGHQPVTGGNASAPGGNRVPMSPPLRGVRAGLPGSILCHLSTPRNRGRRAPTCPRRPIFAAHR